MYHIHLDKLIGQVGCVSYPDAEAPWKIQIARRKFDILARDNFRCVNCGSQEKLTVDHFKAAKPANMRSRLFHSIPENWNLDDCQTLCVDCHQKKDGNIPNRSWVYARA